MSKRASTASHSKGKAKKARASWMKDQVKLLVEQIQAGESVSGVAKLFPEFTTTQIHSKVSNLKASGRLKKIPSSGIAPSLTSGKILYFLY